MKGLKFVGTWKTSVLPKKQRKYRFNAPLHIKIKFLGAHLSKELRAKYGKRALPARKGDKVKIVRGQFKGKSGKIIRVDVKKTKIYIEGMDLLKKDGSKTLYPIHPSNTIITELVSDDRKRIKNPKNETNQSHQNEKTKNSKKSAGGHVKNG
jgi:large subunit ribosomal protein L24